MGATGAGAADAAHLSQREREVDSGKYIFGVGLTQGDAPYDQVF